MPVRSLNSSVFKWPDVKTVDQAMRRWAKDAVQVRTDVLRIGYFGSYARGNWGVGSDLDLILILDRCELSFEKRALEWDVLDLPVPVDVVVYTQAEWDKLAGEKRRFYRVIEREAVWVY
ncbi:MAG: nucleotidyltransferase domain-containing protein [Anaerolineales bacterium]|nr:nucleotidyltransferase domain-containing protein [Anaerolineales bacterium]